MRFQSTRRFKPRHTAKGGMVAPFIETNNALARFVGSACVLKTSALVFKFVYYKNSIYFDTV
jgi:hypothetical protein